MVFDLASPASPLRRIKALRSRARKPKSARPPVEDIVGEQKSLEQPADKAAAGHDERAKSKTGFIAVVSRPRNGIKSRLTKYRSGQGLKKITCLQCSGVMTVNRRAPFSPAAPVALIALGAVLFLAGIKFHLLWIASAPALVLGFIYLRTGRTFWKCASCGFTIPRASG